MIAEMILNAARTMSDDGGEVAPLVVPLRLVEQMGLSDDDVARLKRREKVLLPYEYRGMYGYTFMVLQHGVVPSG